MKSGRRTVLVPAGWPLPSGVVSISATLTFRIQRGNWGSRQRRTGRQQAPADAAVAGVPTQWSAGLKRRTATWRGKTVRRCRPRRWMVCQQTGRPEPPRNGPSRPDDRNDRHQRRNIRTLSVIAMASNTMKTSTIHTTVLRFTASSPPPGSIPHLAHLAWGLLSPTCYTGVA